jgi:hypothetical protein
LGFEEFFHLKFFFPADLAEATISCSFFLFPADLAVPIAIGIADLPQIFFVFYFPQINAEKFADKAQIFVTYPNRANSFFLFSFSFDFKLY